MKIETGVMVVKDGKAWGVICDDGHSIAHGWIAPEDAEIHDPEFCKLPEDVTWAGRHYVAELRTGKLVHVERCTEVVFRPNMGICAQKEKLAMTEFNNATGQPVDVALLIMRLRRYNEWRRGAEFEQPKPAQIGADIDAAAEMLEIMARAIISTLENNLYLADGDDCTLIDLVRLVREA